MCHTRGGSRGDDLDLVEQFNRRFPPDDIFLDLSDSGITVYLNRLDVEEAQRTVAEILSGSERNWLHNDPLTESMRAILSVRSFGLYGGKRNYVGYNRERKVQGRAAKELRRGRHYYANDADFRRM